MFPGCSIKIISNHGRPTMRFGKISTTEEDENWIRTDIRIITNKTKIPNIMLYSYALKGLLKTNFITWASNCNIPPWNLSFHVNLASLTCLQINNTFAFLVLPFSQCLKITLGTCSWWSFSYMLCLGNIIFLKKENPLNHVIAVRTLVYVYLTVNDLI